LLPLYFEDREKFGAKSICPSSTHYMRQEQSLQYWRSVTSTYFAIIFQFCILWQRLTHTYHPEEVLYLKLHPIHGVTCKSYLSLDKYISKKPILIGPDSESEQWVAECKKMPILLYNFK
jgi:ribose-phosphate pyrophosphokinase